ncbi:hypothetical protein ACEUAI_20285 [Aeromonas veronii]|nr:hypothetical protein [Aeromonas veronii]
MQSEIKLKRIGDRDFKFQPVSMNGGEIFGMILLAAVAVMGLFFFKSLGGELNIFDAMLFLLVFPMLLVLRQASDKKRREDNYFKYLETVPVAELKAAEPSLDDASRAAVKKFIERQAVPT